MARARGNTKREIIELFQRSLSRNYTFFARSAFDSCYVRRFSLFFGWRYDCILKQYAKTKGYVVEGAGRRMVRLEEALAFTWMVPERRRKAKLEQRQSGFELQMVRGYGDVEMDPRFQGRNALLLLDCGGDTGRMLLRSAW